MSCTVLIVLEPAVERFCCTGFRVLVVSTRRERHSFCYGTYRRRIDFSRVAFRFEEVVFVDEGSLEATLGNERRGIVLGAIGVIPSGTAHGFRNVGNGVARIHAVFPAREISIRYLDHSAPGTR